MARRLHKDAQRQQSQQELADLVCVVVFDDVGVAVNDV